jgi:mono/diheme cytochrome c family protein
MHQKLFLRSFPLVVVALVIPLAPCLQAQSKPPTEQSRQKDQQRSAATHNHSQYQSEGERIFAQNCSRCHRTPEGFSPRISGTIVRHMRVRASLSEQEERDLLRFLNP